MRFKGEEMDARDIFRVDFESIFAKKWLKREGQEEMERGGGVFRYPATTVQSVHLYVHMLFITE